MHVVATAGHVDHGKSTLIKALTGTDPDRLEEEKARGLTIDLGFAGTKLPSGRGVSFIDVPGHVRFLKNMLAGVGGVDACIFVVAATEGWKPQSEEHLRILSLLGIRHGIVALTKVGHVDDELATIAQMEIADRTEGTFLADAPIVPVDAIDGHGIDDLNAALDHLLDVTPTARDDKKPRLWIDRVFAAKGAGTVVTGTLTGGMVRVEDELSVLPQHPQTHALLMEILARGVLFASSEATNASEDTCDAELLNSESKRLWLVVMNKIDRVFQSSSPVATRVRAAQAKLCAAVLHAFPEFRKEGVVMGPLFRAMADPNEGAGRAAAREHWEKVNHVYTLGERLLDLMKTPPSASAEDTWQSLRAVHRDLAQQRLLHCVMQVHRWLFLI